MVACTPFHAAYAAATASHMLSSLRCTMLSEGVPQPPITTPMTKATLNIIMQLWLNGV